MAPCTTTFISPIPDLIHKAEKYMLKGFHVFKRLLLG